jgi:Zn-dependent alcohol dehydrogenase
MSVLTRAYAALSATSPLAPLTIERREPSAADVAIDILFCGVCHSDLHQSRNEWGLSNYPVVPGHEIVGRVREVGTRVSRFKEGDLVAVGVLYDSCRACSNCMAGIEASPVAATLRLSSSMKRTFSRFLTTLIPQPSHLSCAQVSLPIRLSRTGKCAQARKSASLDSVASAIWRSSSPMRSALTLPSLRRHQLKHPMLGV